MKKGRQDRIAETLTDSESGETYVKGSPSPEIPLFIDVSEW